MKKFAIIAVPVCLVIAISIYLYTKYHVLKEKDFKPDNSKAKSVVDITPSIIAKLQQIVKDGSDGLYVLSIEKLDADVVTSKLNITKASITVDTIVMHQLEALKKLPDDIFRIKFNSLHVNGIGIEDLLNKKQMDIKGIFCNSPVIEVFHKRRPYNEAGRQARDSLSLYQKLKGETNSIKIGRINVSHGTFINSNMAKKNDVVKFNDISIDMKDIQIDSTTENDRNRFLFSEHSTLETKNIVYPTADSLYFFKAGSISVSGEQHKIVALNVELKPRSNKQEFPKKTPVRKERYHLAFPKVVLNDVDWWAMMNREKFIVKELDLNKGTFSIYLDRTPPPHTFKPHNFPHQEIMKLPVPISVSKLNLNNIDMSYEELNPGIKKSATAYFDNVNGVISNVTNIPEKIKTSRYTNFFGKGLFMHKVSMTGKFSLDLSKYKTGDFTADISMDTLDNTTINPLAETLSFFSVKKGQMQKAVAHVEGNNIAAKGTISFYYTDLHITPLKKDSGDDGKLRTKTFISFFANTFLIKNSNPRNGDFRKLEYFVNREKRPNFFNFIWVTILTGISKTIGIPPKFVVK